MNFDDDKGVEIIKNDRDSLLKNVIEKLNILQEDFYRGHIHIDKESLKKKIDEIWDNYNFEMKYRSVIFMSTKKKDVEEIIVEETDQDDL